MVDINFSSLLFGVLTSAAIFIGGKVAIKMQNKIHYLIAFCAGILIATVFLDLLPESLELNDNSLLVFGFVLGSFLTFHLLDKLVFMHAHSHEELEEISHTEENHNAQNSFKEISSKSFVVLTSSGILFHTFLDGLIIGTGFLVGDLTGFLIAIAILLHDFTDGISTVTIMLRHNQSKRSINILLIIAGIFTIFGIIFAQIINFDDKSLSLLLAVFAGFFLYLGASDLLPEAHKERSSVKLVLMTVLGVLLVGGFKFLIG